MTSCPPMRLCNPRSAYVTTLALLTSVRACLPLLPLTPGIAPTRASVLMLLPHALRVASPSFAARVVLCASPLVPHLPPHCSPLAPLPLNGSARPLPPCSVRMSVMVYPHPVLIRMTAITMTTRTHAPWPSRTHAITPLALAGLTNRPRTPSQWNNSTKGPKKHTTAHFVLAARVTAPAGRILWAIASRRESLTTPLERRSPSDDQQRPAHHPL